MTRALTYDEVKAANPCSDRFRRVAKLLGGKDGWNGNRISAADARTAGCTFDDIIWIASAVAEEAWQFDRLIARLSDDEPEDVPLPERIGGQRP